MKNSVFLLLILNSLNVFSQDWQESVRNARKLYHKKEFEKALEQYKKAQKTVPDSIDLSNEIGQTYYKANEFDNAEKYFQQKAASKTNTLDRSGAYHNMGNSRMEKRDYHGAVESYKNALRLNPNDEETRYNLSEALRKLNQQQKQQKEDPKNQSEPKNNKEKKDSNDKAQKDQNKPQQNNPSNNKQRQAGKNGNAPKLPDRSVERLLDKLMRDEAATKRKMGSGKAQDAPNTSGKDW